MKVFISVGHGGKDSGAIGVNGIKESNMNLLLSEVVAYYLEINGVSTKLSRTKDVDNVQATKIAQINEYKPDFMLDLHFNSFNKSASGVEVYYQIKNTIAKNVATLMSKAVAASLNLLNRGAKTKTIGTGVNKGLDYFGMLRNCNYPAVLIETCFIDNAKDMAEFVNAQTETLDKVGKEIAKSICEAYGITFRTISKSGVVIDEDGEIRYYDTKGNATYAGLVKDSLGNIYYINSAKKAVKNCSYDIGKAKTNGILAAGTYQFGADGKLIANSKPNTTTTLKTMTVATKAGLWLQNSDKAWNSKTRIVLMPYKATVEVDTSTSKRLGTYTCVKTKYNGKTGYCAKDYLK